MTSTQDRPKPSGTGHAFGKAALDFAINHGAPVVLAALLWWMLWWGHIPNVQTVDEAMRHVSWVGVVALIYVAAQARSVLAQPRHRLDDGGRQLEAAPAIADVLPAIASAVKGRATILCDGGVRSGLDVTRLVALGADAALAGRAFLFGVGAIGSDGADYVSDMLVEEISVAMRQLGTPDFAALRALTIRHGAALHF